MKVFTIGFTRKSARRFFALLRESGVRRIVDVRLNNVSQLAELPVVVSEDLIRHGRNGGGAMEEKEEHQD